MALNLAMLASALLLLQTCHADTADSNDVYSIRKLHKQHTSANYVRSIRNNYNPYSSPSFSDTESCKLHIECGTRNFNTNMFISI